MNQNQPAGTPDNDLQQAIDNITSSTNSDPVFREPAAPPSPLTDPNQDAFNDPDVGPFPLPDTDATVGVVTPSPEPIAPLDPISLPKLDVSGENPADAKVITKTGFADPDPDFSPAPEQPNTHPAEKNPPSTSSHAPNLNQTPNSSDHQNANHAPSPNSDARQIREAALRELAPILDHANLDPAKKFKICQDILEDLHDSSVLSQAYKAASDIKNEDERANSLLYLIESIDSM